MGEALGSLGDLGIVVTRPVDQAGGLVHRISAQGGRAIRMPLLEITAPDDLRPALAVIARLASFQMAVFVSFNAVQRGLPLVRARGPWPPGLARAAVGQATAQALARADVPATVGPRAPFDSEALLSVPELRPEAVRGRDVVIFRGQGGRELLASTLKERGARVAYAEVYKRAKPQKDVVNQLSQERVDVIQVSSGEGLANLFELVSPQAREWLCDVPFVVPSERLARLALSLGVKYPPIVSMGPGDEATLEALRCWRAAGAARL